MISTVQTAHTPGPWEFIDATKSAKYKFAPTCIIKAGQKQIASFSWNDSSPWFPTKNQSQANARLISAAPDLLDACDFALTILEALGNGSGDAANACRAALAKATGSAQ